MRIDELTKIALNNKYSIERRYRAGHDEIVLYSHHYEIDRQVVRINNETKGILFISNGSSGVNDLNVIKASIEFAETPPEDREEIKKYFYKHNSMKTKGGNPTYLAIRKKPSISYPVLQGSSEDIFEYKVEFTDEEIEEVKKEYGIFLDDFEKIEVKGDKK